MIRPAKLYRRWWARRPRSRCVGFFFVVFSQIHSHVFDAQAHIPGQDDSLESAVGNKVLESSGLLRIEHPVKRGQCETKKDQENLGKILNQIHEEALAISTDETNFMLTVPTFASWNHLKALTSFYMEESKAPSICYHNQGVLSMMGLYAVL